ncbi:MAG: hypothetical protein J6Y35_05905 [Bacteroidales bacterium]|nr:hypothetical protein [Bacteroidales bacterium]
MKKLFLLAAVIVAMLTAACEHSDCVCRYYDQNGTAVAQEDWDGSQVSASQCQAMENNNVVEVDNQTIVASNVSCSTEW